MIYNAILKTEEKKILGEGNREAEMGVVGVLNMQAWRFWQESDIEFALPTTTTAIEMKREIKRLHTYNGVTITVHCR